MKYREDRERTRVGHEELLAHGQGVLVEDPDGEMARLPAPPLLMFDRVVAIERAGSRGRIVAELDVRLDAWYFQCHFRGDPVQPGCLGVDAVWQLVGFYMSACGCPGAGRALGCREVEFAGQIRPHDALVRYDVAIRRLTRFRDSGAALAIGDATVSVDGSVIYTIAGAKVGTFIGIKYGDYPNRSLHSRGGRMRGES